MLDDFENTMQACDDTNEDGSSGDISFEFESQIQLNDSATQLKQTIQSENAASVNNENQSKTNQYEDSNSKCSDSCKISLKIKNKAQIQCSLCMSWYHEVCVGIKKEDPIGIWLCFTCRNVPKNIRNEISGLKNDVIQLKTTTDLILSSVNKLSTQLENCVGGINDRITALTQQVNLHDITMSEAIENV